MSLARKKMRALISRVHGNKKMKELMRIYDEASSKERADMEFHILRKEALKKGAHNEKYRTK